MPAEDSGMPGQAFGMPGQTSGRPAQASEMPAQKLIRTPFRLTRYLYKPLGSCSGPWGCLLRHLGRLLRLLGCLLRILGCLRRLLWRLLRSLECLFTVFGMHFYVNWSFFNLLRCRFISYEHLSDKNYTYWDVYSGLLGQGHHDSLGQKLFLWSEYASQSVGQGFPQPWAVNLEAWTGISDVCRGLKCVFMIWTGILVASKDIIRPVQVQCPTNLFVHRRILSVTS